MQLFIDSADPKEIQEAFEWGVIDGVTTNPSLAAKVGKPYKNIVREILDIVHNDATVSLEVTATEKSEMVQQAKRLAEIDERIVVKVPCTWDGITATKALSSEGILVNVTLVFSPTQALLAAKAGAFYISPFAGRLDDIQHGADEETLAEIVATLENYEYQSQVLMASVRNVEHVVTAGLIGVDIATVPFATLEKLVHHPLTDQGLEKFLKDWDDAGLELPV